VSGLSHKSILTLFGTRPEVIKLAPVLLELERRREVGRTINVVSGQHADLVAPLADFFGIRIDYDLNLMIPNQNSQALLHRIVSRVSSVVGREGSDMIVVQGDTTTALAGAIVGRQCGVPVAHIEAGLRSGNLCSPYPEEINRISITQLAAVHFAATASNRDSLLREGVDESAIIVTGNPIVDALRLVIGKQRSETASSLIPALAAPKCIVLTTHRRESFGPALERNLRVIRSFIEEHSDTHLVFPVHPNPNVKAPAADILSSHPRITLTSPLPYANFIALLSNCWLVISDSGGVQEEVPSLGKPLLILRDSTERWECIEAGMARLVGSSPGGLRAMLEEAYQTNSWVNSVHRISNPFGDGHSAKRIVDHCIDWLHRRSSQRFFVGSVDPLAVRYCPGTFQCPS
jgi:UDP-N-acetylglucosamine 2-epimerase (non-hydrolysing)